MSNQQINKVGFLASIGHIYLFAKAHTTFAKNNFLTNVSSANEAEGYRYMSYMARIMTPEDVTIYCV